MSVLLLISCSVQQARADDCDVLAARLAASTGAEFISRSESGSLFFGVVDGSRLSAGCGMVPSVVVGTPKAYPGPAFYQYAALAAGAVTPAPAASIIAVARQCVAKAYLAANEGLSDTEGKGFGFTCLASRLGGIVLTISGPLPWKK